MTVWRVSSDTQIIDRGVYLSARAVKVGGMDMNAQRLAADMLGIDAGGIGEPVVRMDDVKVLGACHHTGNDGVVVYFLVQVGGIASGKLHTAEIVDVHIVEIGIDVVAQTVVVVGIHHVGDAALHIFAVNVAPCDRHTVHCHNAARRLVLVAEGARQTQHRLHVTLRVQSLGDAEISGSESTIHMRRILPSEH